MSYTGFEFIFSEIVFKSLKNPQKEWNIYKKSILKKIKTNDRDLKKNLSKLKLTISHVEESEAFGEDDLRNLIYRIDFNLLGHEKNSSGTPCPVLTFFCEFLRINNPLNRNGLSPYFLAIRCYGEYNDIWIDIITFFSDGKYMLTSTQGDENYFFEKISNVPFFDD